MTSFLNNPKHLFISGEGVEVVQRMSVGVEEPGGGRFMTKFCKFQTFIASFQRLVIQHAKTVELAFLPICVSVRKPSEVHNASTQLTDAR